TTAFLPTFVTAPIGELGEALRRAAGLVADPPVGSRVLGVHMEGPFLAATRAGAHRLDSIVPPAPEAVAGLLAAGARAVPGPAPGPAGGGGLAAGATPAPAGGG